MSKMVTVTIHAKSLTSISYPKYESARAMKTEVKVSMTKLLQFSDFHDILKIFSLTARSAIELL